MRVTKMVGIFTSAAYRTLAIKSEKSGRFLERQSDLPREVVGRPSAWSTASAVSWTRWSDGKRTG